ncbi:SAM-dependent methyltransferase [Enterococcus sp. JM4C]|uniref:tRNA (adenine(22)-N(1))-methyltransferase n=1 Tax=Candidatus Enterococcus huntleyi TaxID=1857217 RepID=UPI00137B5DCB|nr:tRNA (adenine(22)-N(1))-methyltransferase TrmK [Enterococcus sp. JM4C]KAF1298678.1 SAM-dependent methyltransferase [Enterococcus sp. JM4C]
MNQQELSTRLATVGAFVPEGAHLADIGSDHAYLPVALVLDKKIDFAVAGEVVQGPFTSAVNQVKKNNLSQQITVRLASGLEAIIPEDEITAITIAGMGGSLIRDILAQGQANNKLSGDERLILQPNIGEKTLRTWLMNESYEIIAERILEENQKIYEVIVAEKVAQPINYSQEQLLFGPILGKEKNAVFLKKWQRELKQRKHVLQQLSLAETVPSGKVAQVEAEIKQIEECLA